ncbi:helix-turn-helix domain-containing protein [Streptomyces sp. NPDC085524]|uniref:helix-turn-helix domain-containing protein n=1 Tax=Streptomyces sp. NPDC085524 TaxID=3365728 RepID=UPI0037CD361F
MELLSVKQAADLLGVDDSRVRQLLHDGQLQGHARGDRCRPVTRGAFSRCWMAVRRWVCPTPRSPG